MNKKFIIKESKEFDRIIKDCKKIKNYNFIIFYEENNELYNKYGISVGKKIGKAHIRNKLKRKTRSILRNYKNNYEKKYNCIIIVRNSCLNLTYEEMNNSLINLLSNIK